MKSEIKGCGIKPLNRKSYGSIGHLPGSLLGPADHKVPEGQANIATVKVRDKHDRVIVQEKLDGSNVGVALIDDSIYAITRAGYLATSSKYAQHHAFAYWVLENEDRFRNILQPNWHLCGEWMLVAHGTKYVLPHEPFVAFDIIDSAWQRMPYAQFEQTAGPEFAIPKCINNGPAMSVDDALSTLGEYGFHGAAEPIEGAVWRVERKDKVDYLCKYVKPSKENGKYLFGNQDIYNLYDRDRLRDDTQYLREITV